MNIHELDTYDLGDAVKFNDELNPKIWGADEKMRPEVREQLQQIADDFQQFLGIDVEVKDITVSGSNAAYTYTPHSDIDLHLVVDLPEADRNDVYRELFDAKKYAYNDMHDIKIGGYDVELYVQDANKKHHSQGIYSIMNNDWVSVPKRRKPDVDDISVKSKFEDLGHRIESAIASGDLDKITDMAEKLRDYRQAGLDAHGEFGPENLAFKILRTQGLIKQLYDARNAAKDKLLSLDERKKKKKKSVKYGYGAYWYPGTAYAGQDHPAGTEGGDGGGGDGGESLRESTQTSNEEILQDFVDFCVDQLKIEHMPRVRLRRDPQWPAVNRTFGRYNDETKTLEVAWGQRHIMDVLRTVAHELTHKHQHEREGESMGPDAGETGSAYENEANARAGVLMRDYGRLHPEYFTVGQVHELEESASGYIPTKAQAKDPRFSMALTVDVKPGQIGKEANKLKLKTDRQGQPQIANPNGLFENLFVEYKRYKAAEDYSPDSPPGPEFKPTMPAGTLRVDVSDVYDWYKLGQHISNMKGLGQHDFGAGPPSSIISFGDEDTEHKFIRDLEATGLDVTDIDPVDPRQPPGGKIKTDPTYNVDEVIQTPVPKGKDAEQYYKFIVGKARMGRPLTRAEQDYVKMYQVYRQQKLAEFAPGAQRDDRGPDEEEILRQYAAQWYNGDEDPRVEKLLATMGWEIGQNEDEAGGAFVIRSGDINGDSFISWTDAELSALNETSNERLERYLQQAGQQVDRRQEHMARARDRLNKGYEIYHAEDPTFIVHRFEANTPQEARRYYERYDADYDSDVDYDLQLRRATGLVREKSQQAVAEDRMSQINLDQKLARTPPAWQRFVKGLPPQLAREFVDERPQPNQEDIAYFTPLGLTSHEPVYVKIADLLRHPENQASIARSPDDVIAAINQRWGTKIQSGKKYDLNPSRYQSYASQRGAMASPSVAADGVILFGAGRFVAAALRGDDRMRVWSMTRKQAVAEGKIKLYTDPNYFGAEVDDYKATGPVVNIPANRLVGFEPDDKMDQPASKANVEKIVAGLKQGAKLPPLLVRKYKDGYQVLNGHHRFWAYKLLGIKAIPAQVVPDEDIEEIGKQGVAEDAGGYPDVLYHGSTQEIKGPLTPRQAHDIGGATGSNKNAIYATDDPNFAIAYSLAQRGSDTGTLGWKKDPRLIFFGGKIRRGQNVYLHVLPTRDAQGQPLFTQGAADAEWHSLPNVKSITPLKVETKPVDQYLHLLRKPTPEEQKMFLANKAKDQQTVNEDQDLDEVKMSPGALEKFATSDAAKGIRAGFEAELIFRDTQGSSDDIDPEPDYDADERAYSISQVIEFFTMDEYGYGLSDRERNRLEENLDEAYMQWRDEQIISDFRDDAEDLIREKLLDETPLSERIHMYLTDSEQMSDKEADRIIAAGVDAPKFDTSKEQQAYAAENPYYQAYLDALDAAELELDESVEYSVSQQDGYWDEALDDYRDDWSGDDDSFFSDVGLRWMSDIANEFGLDWPVWNMDSGRNNGSRSWEDIGSELQAVVDMPVVVSDNYHSTSRRPGQWIIEPDGSLHADDQSEEAGLEIVSPPMPLLTAIEKLRQVTDWANDPRGGNAYTNGTTGLHMGVSLPTMKSEDATDDIGIDYVKLILFMGDKYVLDQFGRTANTYTASALDKFRQNIKGKKSDPAGVVELLRHGLTELAYRELQKGVGTSKYTSAHIQNGYIEFRSPGGDWLAKSDEEIGILENTMLRFARAMAIAGDPSAERQEYAKKLYKLVTADNPEYADQLKLFSEFSAGTINREQLKKQWADTVLQKELPSVGKNEYEVYSRNNENSPDATVGTLYAQDYDDAYDQFLRQYGRDINNLDVRVKQPWFDVFDDTGKIVKTIRARDIDTATDRAQYEFGERWTDTWNIYRRPDDTPEPKASPRAQVAKRIVAKPKTATEYNYDIVDQRTVELRVVDQFRAETPAEAERIYSQWLKIKDLPNDTADYGYRKNQQAADNQRDSVDIQRRLGVQDVDTDVAQNFSPDYSAYERNSDRIDAIRAQAQQPRQNYELVSDEDPDRVIHRMSNATTDEVRAWIAQQEQGGMPTGFLRTRIVAESTGQHDDEQTQTALDMAAQDYQYKNWADVDMRGTEQAKTAIRRHAVTKLNLAQHKDFNMLGKSRSAIGKGVDQVDREFIDKQIQTARKLGDDVNENFADGKVKGKSRPGRVKRAGASCNGSVTDLRRRAKNASGEKAKMYHWCANMKSGRKK